MGEDTARVLLTRVPALDRELGTTFEALRGRLCGAVARDLVIPIERLRPALRGEA